MKFSECGLKPEILRALEDIGYRDLTPIQEETFPHILKGRDLLAMAETGSGKTGACAVPIVQASDPDVDGIQALILVPTRELAQQYVSEISSIARHTKLAPFCVYGGFSMDVQKAKLKHGVDILVATPGRLIDLLYKTDLALNKVQTFVLDEADEMMDMGFIEDVKFIKDCLIHEHQTLMFSATMPSEIESLARESLNDPVKIHLNKDKVTPSSVEHRFQMIPSSKRFSALCEFLDAEKPKQAIIFCNTRIGADKLERPLKQRYSGAEIIHGGFEQGKRTSVSTDLAGRGLDFTHVTHIINYELSRAPENYTHRTGRAGRMGRKGIAYTMMTSMDLRGWNKLMAQSRVKPIWTGKIPDICKTGSTKPRSDDSSGNSTGEKRPSRSFNRRKPNRNRRPNSGSFSRKSSTQSS